MREWCLVIDALSAEDARDIGDALSHLGLDLEVDQGGRSPSKPRVWCFGESEAAVRKLASEIRQTLMDASMWEVVMWGRIWVWNEQLHLYVDPAHPDEDPDAGDLDPDEIRWRVRLDTASVSDCRRVRRQVPRLLRPVIETGLRHIDIGAADARDAEEVARVARALRGVSSATPSELGRLQRWWLRERLLGNYIPPDGGGGT
jgi:hypothetical protein